MRGGVLGPGKRPPLKQVILQHPHLVQHSMTRKTFLRYVTPTVH